MAEVAAEQPPADTTGATSEFYKATAPIQFPQYEQAALTLDSSTVEDIDQLWDWVRSDRSGTTDFLGYTHANSQAFHKQIADIILAQRTGTAWFQSIHRGGALIGFVALQIIKTPHLSGTMRVYIAPGTLNLTDTQIINDIANAIQQVSPQMTLVCITADSLRAEQYTAAGFTSQYVLTRPASPAAVSHDRP